MGLLDTSYGTVSANKPKKSDRILPRENMNIRGLLDAATAIPFAGDLLSGGLAAYDAAKGDYGSAAMNALSVLPILSAGMVKKAGSVADAVNAPKLTEFEQRHLTAQRNAALPVKQGGLGLPPNNTAMDRAKAMGFNQEAYHTSRTGVDTNVLDSGKYAIAPFDAIGTHFGTKEAAFDRFNRTVGTTEQIKGSSYPVLIKNDKQLLNDYADYYKEEPLGLMLSAQSDYGNLPKSNAALREKYFNSYDVIPYVNDVESAGSVSYIAPPANIRSRFAAFDPMRRHEADLLGYADPRLLGAMAGGGLLGLGGYSLMGDQ